jgi:hypothetical protein
MITPGPPGYAPAGSRRPPAPAPSAMRPTAPAARPAPSRAALATRPPDRRTDHAPSMPPPWSCALQTAAQPPGRAATLPAGRAATLPAGRAATLPAGRAATLPAGRAATLPADTCIRVAPAAAQLPPGPGPRAILARAHEANPKICYKIVNNSNRGDPHPDGTSPSPRPALFLARLHQRSLPACISALRLPRPTVPMPFSCHRRNHG